MIDRHGNLAQYRACCRSDNYVTGDNMSRILVVATDAHKVGGGLTSVHEAELPRYSQLCFILWIVVVSTGTVLVE